MERLAVCAIIKNEAPYLLEWINFHRLVGFDHFVLYDNGSTDGGAALVGASSFADCVTIRPWPSRPGQLTAYQDFIDRDVQRFDWVAFIDVDEFIHPLERRTLRDLLAGYAGCSAVLIHWLVFGPSGHTHRPDGAVLTNFTQRVPEHWPVNKHVKTLARTADLLGVGATPHVFALRGAPCDANGQLVGNEPIREQACHDRLVINHYFTKSQAEWEAKVARGHATTQDDQPQRYSFGMFESVRSSATVVDRRILEMLETMPPEQHEVAMISAMDFLRGLTGEIRGLSGHPPAGPPLQNPGLLQRIWRWLLRR